MGRLYERFQNQLIRIENTLQNMYNPRALAGHLGPQYMTTLWKMCTFPSRNPLN